VLVEEKLDGASVVLWRKDVRVECALRSGVGTQDRGKQLGPLRAWIGERSDRLRELLDGRALYGEWLLLSHAVAYDALPDYLVALDLWNPDSAFAVPDVRNELCARAGLTTPPQLFRGALKDVDQLEAMLGRSRAGSAPMEGAVVRTLDGAEPRIAKLLRADFSPASDPEWRRGRPRNQLRKRELSWH
jgi:atypical dual specificity phosphatase